MAGQIINVSVLADTKKFTSSMKSLGNQSGGLDKLKNGFKTLAKTVAIAGAAVGTAAVAFGKVAVDAAADLEQSMGAIDSVFKKNSKQVHKWATNAATDVGLSKNSYNELATLMGSQLKNGGTSLDELGKKTNDLIKVGADLSSMFGGTTADAVGALSSALKGERDPIERYGVSLKQATIDAKAAELGFKKVGGSLSAEANQAATLALIMDQTKDAQGNFAKESDTLAHQQQVLAAKFDNVKATLGTHLLPVITQITAWVSDKLGPAFQTLTTWIQTTAMPAFQALAGWFTTTILPVLQTLGQNIIAIVLPAFQALGNFVMTTLVPAWQSAAQLFVSNVLPVLQTIGTVIATKVVPALTAFGTFVASKVVPIVQSLGQVIATKVVPVLGSMASFIAGKVVPQVLKIAQTVGSKLEPVFKAVIPVIAKIADKLKEWMPTIQKVISVVVKIVGKVVEFGASILGKVLPPVIKFAGFLAGKLIDGIGTAIKWVGKIVSWIVDFGKKIGDGIKVVADFASKIGEKVGEAIQWFLDIPGRIGGIFADAGKWLLDAGKNIVDGLLNGIGNFGKKIANWFLDKIPGWIKTPFKKALGIASPSKVFKGYGKNIVDGLSVGIESSDQAKGAIDKLTANITKAGQNLVKAEAKRLIAARRKENAKIIAANKDLAKRRDDDLAKADKITDSKKRAAEKRRINAEYKSKAKDTKPALSMDDATKQATKNLKSTLEAGKAAIKIAKANSKEWQNAVAAQAKVARQLKAASEKLATMKADRANLQNSIASTVMGGLDLSSALNGGTDSFGFGSTKTSFQAVGGLVAEAKNKAKTFSERMKALVQAGFPNSFIQFVAGYGIDGGVQIADAILSGTGAEQAALKADWGAYNSYAKGAGDAIAGQLYDAGIQAQEGLIKGLEKQNAALDKAADKIADRITRRVKKKLGIKSPSTVFRDQVGVQLVRGTIAGLTKEAPVLSAKLDELASPPSTSGITYKDASTTATTTTTGGIDYDKLAAAMIQAVQAAPVNVNVGVSRTSASEITRVGAYELDRASNMVWLQSTGR